MKKSNNIISFISAVLILFPLFLEIIGIKDSIFVIFVFINLLNCLLLFFSKRDFFVFSKTSFFIILILITGIVINLVFSFSLYRSIPYALLYISSIFFVFVYININKEINEQRFFLPLFVVLINLANILSLFFNTLSLQERSERFFFLSNTNQFLYSPSNTSSFTGVLNMVGLILLLPLILDQTQTIKKRLFFILNFIFLLFFLITSFMRSAYIGFILSLYLFFLYSVRQRKIKILITFLMIMVSFLMINKNFMSFLSQFSNPFGLDISKKAYFGREHLFLYGLKGFFDRPIIGYGLNTYSIVSKKFSIEGSYDISSHNFFIDLLSDAGFFGLFIIFLILFHIFKNRENLKKPKKDGYYFAIIALLVTSQSFSFLFFPGFFFVSLYLFLQITKSKSFRKRKFFVVKKAFILFSLILLLIVSQLVLLSKMVAIINKSQAKIIFPFFPEFYTIEEIAKTEFIKKIVRNDYFYQRLLADYYRQKQNKGEEIKHRLETYFLYPYKMTYVEAKELYSLLYTEISVEEAEKFILEFIKTRAILSKKTKLIDENYNFYINCSRNTLNLCLNIKYMYIPKPNSKETIKIKDSTVTYVYNKDGLNSTKNYPYKKGKNIFRIMVLGNTNAFGFLVNTEKNWVSNLELELNTKINSSIKFEVLNLAYHNYDINYSVARYILQGKKYDPDLIIWLYDSFLFDQETFTPFLEKYYYVNSRKDDPFYLWKQAEKEYYAKIDEKKILERQKGYLKLFFDNISSPVLFLSFSMPPQEILSLLKKNDAVVILLDQELIKDPKYSYENLYILNENGHRRIAEEIRKIIFRNFL